MRSVARWLRRRVVGSMRQCDSQHRQCPCADVAVLASVPVSGTAERCVKYRGSFEYWDLDQNTLAAVMQMRICNVAFQFGRSALAAVLALRAFDVSRQSRTSIRCTDTIWRLTRQPLCILSAAHSGSRGARLIYSCLRRHQDTYQDPFLSSPPVSSALSILKVTQQASIGDTPRIARTRRIALTRSYYLIPCFPASRWSSDRTAIQYTSGWRAEHA